MQRGILTSLAVVLSLNVFVFGVDSASADTDDGYLESQMSDRASTMFKTLVLDGADACSADGLHQDYHRNGFEAAAALLGIVQDLVETGNIDDSAEAREERRRAFTKYTALPCSRGGFRDPNNAIITEQKEDALASGIHNMARTDPATAVAEGRKLVSRPLPGCSVVVEWALVELEGNSPFDEDNNWAVTEVAFRSLLELQSRGYLPKSMNTEVDLFFLLSTVFLEAGNREFSLALALAARETLEDFDNTYPDAQIVRPAISISTITERIRNLTPISPQPWVEK